MANLNKLPPVPPACEPPGVTDPRGLNAFRLRFGTATADAVATASLKHTTNGDETAYVDKSATYSKCLRQEQPGIVDPAAFQNFRNACGNSSGMPEGTANYEVNPMLGGVTRLNDPLGAFALQPVGDDSQDFGDAVVSPPPTVASAAYAVELVELYWASLLRDVPFTEYPENATAIAAADELTSLVANYAGPTSGGKVAPQLLFRGGFGPKPQYFAGENIGPYLSQLCIWPTSLGAQAIDQKMQTYMAGQDFMTDPAEWFAIQNGAAPTEQITIGDKRRYMHNGRGLAAFTHVDELYQAYLTAYLVIKTWKLPANPGSPYNVYKNQQPFGTFGGPDIAATLGAIAKAAINAVWYQKWVVHLRHRPEAGGGIVQLMQTGFGGTIQAHVNPIVLNSEALKLSQLRNGSWLLSQAFPEGSPPHPAYPTGHGTVAGACITALKFFFDCSKKLEDLGLTPLVPSPDGLLFEPYTGPDAGAMTINGELHKLAHNISFGHGIHAGIHWRSDTDSSLLLGEAVALKFLQDQAFSYQENFDITLTKMDGTNVTLSNH